MVNAIRAILQEELTPIKQDMAILKQDVAILTQDVVVLKQDVAHMKGQLNENTRFIDALLHRTEELDAKFDGLLHITATKEGLFTFSN